MLGALISFQSRQWPYFRPDHGWSKARPFLSFPLRCSSLFPNSPSHAPGDSTASICGNVRQQRSKGRESATGTQVRSRERVKAAYQRQPSSGDEYEAPALGETVSALLRAECWLGAPETGCTRRSRPSTREKGSHARNRERCLGS